VGGRVKNPLSTAARGLTDSDMFKTSLSIILSDLFIIQFGQLLNFYDQLQSIQSRFSSCQTQKLASSHNLFFRRSTLPLEGIDQRQTLHRISILLEKSLSGKGRKVYCEIDKSLKSS
jgi:hypothetical protein